MSNSLLPPNSTSFELCVEQVVAERFDALPVHHRFNIDPMRCDAALLPFLARDLSVDVWQESWDEDRKRRVVAASLAVHRYKGTVYAVKTAVAAVNAAAQVVEWLPPARLPLTLPTKMGGGEKPNTVRVQVKSADVGAVSEDIAAAVLASKPLHVQATVVVSQTALCRLWFSCVAYVRYSTRLHGVAAA